MSLSWTWSPFLSTIEFTPHQKVIMIIRCIYFLPYYLKYYLYTRTQTQFMHLNQGLGGTINNLLKQGISQIMILLKKVYFTHLLFGKNQYILLSTFLFSHVNSDNTSKHLEMNYLAHFSSCCSLLKVSANLPSRNCLKDLVI